MFDTNEHQAGVLSTTSGKIDRFISVARGDDAIGITTRESLSMLRGQISTFGIVLYSANKKHLYFGLPEKEELIGFVHHLFESLGREPVLNKQGRFSQLEKTKKPKLVFDSFTILDGTRNQQTGESTPALLVNLDFTPQQMPPCVMYIQANTTILPEKSVIDVLMQLTDKKYPWMFFPEDRSTDITAYNLIMTSKGLQSRPFRFKPLRLKTIEENYTNTPTDEQPVSTLELIKNLFSKFDPRIGKVVLLHGVPGTGKSHLIKSLITEWYKGKDSYTTHIIGKPSIFFQSMDAYTAATQMFKRCMFVFEDGASLLDEQKRLGIDSFSSLLNITDGIVSSGRKDIFIFTFNNPISSIDTAFLRPGRLFTSIPFNDLTIEEATNWITTNLKSTNEKIINESLERSYSQITKRYNLASLYSCLWGANDLNISNLQKSATIGFEKKK
ncbi:MAG: AAA family ATPase [Spirochaetes bacterium]|nr:AAA family ATPase [Spirochaetota bacterium]